MPKIQLFKGKLVLNLEHMFPLLFHLKIKKQSIIKQEVKHSHKQSYSKKVEFSQNLQSFIISNPNLPEDALTNALPTNTQEK